MNQQLEDTATALGVDKIRRHIFLCCDQTKPKCCDKAVSLDSWNYLKSRLQELNLTGPGESSAPRPTVCASACKAPPPWCTRRGPGTTPALRR